MKSKYYDANNVIKEVSHQKYKLRFKRKEQDVDATHTRYKHPIDNLIYCMLLQAAKDLDHVDNEMTKTDKETAHTFFESGDAKHFYDYLKGEPKND